MNPKVDRYLQRQKQWKEELIELRRIILSCGLTEELKWGEPCYTVNGGNVVLMHGFKEYCALLFMKGALIDDGKGVLIQQTKNVQSGRQIRFTSLQEITKKEALLKKYIRSAIKAEKAGLKVAFKPVEEFAVPDELQERFTALPAFKVAFKALSPGRQRGYLLFFSAPKQSKTRTARIEKFMPNIFAGKGMHD